ncbi:cytochrome P450 monooxygenase-like protein [Sporormia fimetaria CBS 119925]|uniref:Cytochrome P450 monooxygenase-like protein n=1 Tax=Sporormia fimetaria CBS 119925 TaxID=1340428 RepID=A0A6A6UVU0_9PLEO|nr:cytochrome P450 monooxygenase-like protein [Sporormia fimetaria CBS 119925]
MGLVILAGAFAFVAYLVTTTIYNLYFHPLSKVPGPFLCRISSLPQFYHACKQDRHIWLWQLFQIYGSKVRAAPNLVLFNSAEAYNNIYSSRSNVKRSKFYDAWSRNEDDINILMTSSKEIHARKRRLMNSAFSEKSVTASGAFIAKHVDRWNELLLHEGATKESGQWSPARDIATWANHLVFDILGDLCFGADFRTKEPGPNKLKKIPDAFDIFVTFTYPITKTPMLEWLVWLKPRGLSKLIETFAPQEIKDHYAFIEDMVTERLKAEKQREAEGRAPEREDMLHFLIAAKDPETGKTAFGFKELVAEANLLVLAGSDTTATTLSGIFFYLVHEERVYKKLLSEIRETFSSPDEIMHGSKLSSCTYLRACIYETLRLAPAAPCEMPREVLEGGMKIEGEFYAPGVEVGTPHWSLGRNELQYGDATTFRPERWIPSEEIETLNPKEEVSRIKRGLHTFSNGPGDCIGQKLAMLEMSIVVARTLWRMDVRLAPGHDVGAGDNKLGWGCRNPREYMLRDAYIALREGPMVQFAARGP